jgi:hypothetical protein
MNFFAIILATLVTFSTTNVAMAQATCNPAIQVCR